MISYVFSPHPFPVPPSNQQPPPPYLTTSPCAGGETTDFLPAPSVCFSKRQYPSIYHWGMFCITQTFREMFSKQQFCLSLRTAGFSYLHADSSHSCFALPPSQTPSGLLLATHSPLLSGIHFWSSLSPVGPLSPARLQGHSSLFQVGKSHMEKTTWGQRHTGTSQQGVYSKELLFES